LVEHWTRSFSAFANCRFAREAALFLVSDVDLAWRMWALTLLAEELAE